MVAFDAGQHLALGKLVFELVARFCAGGGVEGGQCVIDAVEVGVHQGQLDAGAGVGRAAADLGVIGFGFGGTFGRFGNPRQIQVGFIGAVVHG